MKISTPVRMLLVWVLGLAFLTQLQAALPTVVTVDPAKTWHGFMNVFNLPADGGGYQFGQPWGTADLRAGFSGATLTLAPNINAYDTNNPYWTKPDGSPNKQMDANFYVEDASLAGQTVNFVGMTLANTLVSPYTSVAFIKEFTPSFNPVAQQTVSLATGTPFSLSLTTNPGNIIQYGFETIGPDANPATAAALGSVMIAVVPEPGALSLLGAGLAGFLIRRVSRR